jgi:hypothetical protein
LDEKLQNPDEILYFLELTVNPKLIREDINYISYTRTRIAGLELEKTNNKEGKRVFRSILSLHSLGGVLIYL